MDTFAWKGLGNIDVGRERLGPDVPVLAYRMMEYALRQALVDEYDAATADRIFITAGRMAGHEFCREVLDCSLEVDAFLAQLKTTLQDLKICLLRVERFDPESSNMVVSVAEDLDCSGLPTSGECVCRYDEGFIAGIMSEYMGARFDAEEVDCWASGARVCRFHVTRV